MVLEVDTKLQEHRIIPLVDLAHLPSRSLSIVKREILIAFETEVAIKEKNMMFSEDKISREIHKKREQASSEKSNIIRKPSIIGISTEHLVAERKPITGVLSTEDNFVKTHEARQAALGKESHLPSIIPISATINVSSLNTGSTVPLHHPSNHHPKVLTAMIDDEVKPSPPLSLQSGIQRATMTTLAARSNLLQVEYQKEQLRYRKRQFTTDKRKVQPIVNVPGVYAEFKKKFYTQHASTQHTNSMLSPQKITHDDSIL